MEIMRSTRFSLSIIYSKFKYLASILVIYVVLGSLFNLNLIKKIKVDQEPINKNSELDKTISFYTYTHRSDNRFIEYSHTFSASNSILKNSTLNSKYAQLFENEEMCSFVPPNLGKNI
jgi:hypothetical protein